MSSINRRAFLRASAVAGVASSLGVSLSAAQSSLPATPVANAGPEAAKAIYTAERPLMVGMVLFEGFQLLDVFGPLEMFTLLRDRARIVMLAMEPGLVKQGPYRPSVLAERSLADPGPLDLVFVPGGGGTRSGVTNAALIAAIKALAEATPRVASVCTGSALLAKAGVLDGHRATTNKRAYAWATSQGPRVRWVPEARWVEDGKFASSSGISAGMDLALGLIAGLFDRETAVGVANAAEYTWHEDATWDPFAKLNGLVP